MKSYDVPSMVDSDPNSNITDLLISRAKSDPNLSLFARQQPDDSWEPVTASEFLSQVEALAKGLIAVGIQPGQAVGIMSKTRYEWTLLDFALWFAGAVSVPVYETSAPAQMEWILGNSDCVALFAENEEHRSRYQEIAKQVPLVRQVFLFDAGDLDKLAEQGREIGADVLEQRRTASKLNDLATIIYTSGTTGKPKGCELAHRGFIDLCKNAQLALPDVLVAGQSSILLFLPLAHVYARFIEVLCVYAGLEVAHLSDPKNVAPALQSYKPTFLLAVPRVFEKVYNAAEQKAEAGGKGKIFRQAAGVAVDYSRALDTKEGPSLGLKLKFKLFDALVYKKLRHAMGGRVKYAISGGAPLGERLGHFFRAIGLIVLEGYGLTETTAPAMIGRPNALKIGKVGILLPGCGVKISDDGEILLRGSNVMRGYWRNPEATNAVMEGDWFHTGDIGELDEDGFLSITGRKKELLITAGGKNVAPAPMEDPIRANPLVGQVVMVGDSMPYIAAVISLDPEMLPIWLANNGEDKDMSLEQASRSPKVIAEIQRAIDAVNATVSRAETIKRFTILRQAIGEDTGHLTPSLKVKREVVMKDFAKEIAELYQ